MALNSPLSDICFGVSVSWQVIIKRNEEDVGLSST